MFAKMHKLNTNSITDKVLILPDMEQCMGPVVWGMLLVSAFPSMAHKNKSR
jgi:hypothetical protein